MLEFDHMNKRLLLVLLGLLALGAGCSNSQVTLIPSQPTSRDIPLVTNASLSNWQTVDAGTFTLSLPSGWKFNKLQGIDSYAGEFVDDNTKLEFDYGRYSDSLAKDNDPDHFVTYETIDGHKAKIVVPKVTGKGTVGVYFDDLADEGQKTKLQLSGQNLNASQQEVALKMFQTLKFKQ